MAAKRKYEPIWERVKTSEKHSCTVEVEPFLVARVKKAVIKEKSRDFGFKLLNDHDSFFLEFSYDAVRKRLKAVLTQTGAYLGVDGVNNEVPDEEVMKL